MARPSLLHLVKRRSQAKSMLGNKYTSQLAYNVYELTSTKKSVTGNSVILHKALLYVCSINISDV